MAVAEWLLEILVCPECRTKVVLSPDGRLLRCSGCRRAYPVRDDIPQMLVSEAIVEPPADTRS